jgi:hypothetical protein
LFDWYRFAREMWDWWWYPFDTDAVAASTTMRPYFQARHDTPLLEYYYDATGTAADYNARHEPAGGIGANRRKIPLPPGNADLSRWRTAWLWPRGSPATCPERPAPAGSP